MRLILVPDLHIPNNVSISGIKTDEKIIECVNLFKLIKEIADKNKPDAICFLGDFYDTPTHTSTDITSLFSKLVSDLALSYPLIFICGNHDIINSSDTVITNGEDEIKFKSNTLSAYKNFANVTVIDKPTVTETDEGNEIIFMPYSNNIIEDFNNLKLGKKYHNRICFGHFEVRTPFAEIHYEDKGKSLVTCDLLTHELLIDLTALGHIHEPDVLSENVIYLGSARNINFSNTKEKKFIYIWNEEEPNKIAQIENPYTFIYKTINCFDELKEYCDNADEQKLAKTKIKFRYSTNEDLKEMNKIKMFFKSVKYEKQMTPIETEKGQITKADLEGLGSLLQNNLLDKYKIKEYAYKFVPPVNKDDTDEIIKILEGNKNVIAK